MSPGAHMTYFSDMLWTRVPPRIQGENTKNTHKEVEAGIKLSGLSDAPYRPMTGFLLFYKLNT